MKFYGYNNGVEDATDALAYFLGLGGDLHIPSGNYLIKGQGADSGGVNVTLTNHTYITCAPDARFFTDSLDNDLIRLNAGVEDMEFVWEGGLFDQRNQKVSNVVPFAADYPPPTGFDGESNTAEALSIRGEYNGTYGFRKAIVSGVSIDAGDHWETAGGDSGMFVSGARLQIIRDCFAQGSRDLGLYCSGSNDGSLRCQTVIENNQFINCFHAAAVKRSPGDSMISRNAAVNCARGFMVNHITGPTEQRARIVNNSGDRVGMPIRVDGATGFTVADNQFSSLGAFLSDASTVESKAGGVGIQINGSHYGTVRGNTVLGVTSGSPYTTHLLEANDKTINGANRETFRTRFFDNVGKGLDSEGVDYGTQNVWTDNVVY